MLEIPLDKFSELLVSHPTLLLSSRCERYNTLSPQTWYLPLSCDPPLLGISLKPSSQSFHNIRESGDFLLGIPAGFMVKVVHFCGVHSGKDMDKLRYINCTAYRAKSVSPLAVSGCMANLEFRVREIKPSGNRPLIIGELINLLIAPEYGDEEGWFDGVTFIHHLGGYTYRIGEKIVTLNQIHPGYIPPDAIGIELHETDFDNKGDFSQ
jgi:flavin reductase (DIM6/NTAB) family NADH-FMN oxidoreductase RutF